MCFTVQHVLILLLCSSIFQLLQWSSQGFASNCYEAQPSPAQPSPAQASNVHHNTAQPRETDFTIMLVCPELRLPAGHICSSQQAGNANSDRQGLVGSQAASKQEDRPSRQLTRQNLVAAADSKVGRKCKIHVGMKGNNAMGCK